MNEVADELQSRLAIAKELKRLPESLVATRPRPGKWSAKEILGHLIDSAANNHQRFVRLQMQLRLELVGYDGDKWVAVQQHQDQSWTNLVALWESYNRHLMHVIRHIDPAKLGNTWLAPDGQVLSLEFVVHDYVRHLKHHLDQIVCQTGA